jgi:hypothetical protein
VISFSQHVIGWDWRKIAWDLVQAQKRNSYPKYDPGRKSLVLGNHGKPGGRCQRCKLSDSELADPGGARMNHLLIRSDHKVLFQSFQVHTCPVISDFHFVRGDIDIDFGGICIVSVVNGFAYRTNLAVWIFGASAAFALFIAVMTVSFQSIKAALTDPVNSLRYE